MEGLSPRRARSLQDDDAGGRRVYPIHPELFERLYQDWGSLDKFQRTRGVLRLMASVIHILWERQDSGLMILPASIPIDATSVQSELTRYLEPGWSSVIGKDVDGPSSTPLSIDQEVPTLGRYSAVRRVARTIYLGSAPTYQGRILELTTSASSSAARSLVRA